jgi:uncharacterized protein (DUF2384 family)
MASQFAFQDGFNYLLEQSPRIVPASARVSGNAIGAFAGLGGANTFSAAIASQVYEKVSVQPDMGYAQQIVGGEAPAVINLRAPDHPRDRRQEALVGRITGPVQVLKKIAEEWALSTEELAALLAYSDSQHVSDLFAGRISLREQDREDRVRLLYQCYRVISQIFAESSCQADWVRAPNPDLGDRSPLELMIKNRIPGMIVVRNLVDRLVGR